MNKKSLFFKVIRQLFLRWLIVLSLLFGVIAIIDLLHDSGAEQQLLSRLDSQLLDKIESLSILAGLLVFALEIPEQRKRANYEAWQVINSAQQQGGSGGRLQALQDLNQNGVSLARLTAPSAYLGGIDLRKADLTKAILNGAILDDANLSEAILIEAELKSSKLRDAFLIGTKLCNTQLVGADLTDANLENADLKSCNLISSQLSRSNLRGANLEGATLAKAILAGAILSNSIMERTDLRGATLSGAKFDGADCSNADFTSAILTGAEMRGVNLKMANVTDADFSGTKQLTLDQIKSAQNWEKAKYDNEIAKSLGIEVTKSQVVPIEGKR